MSRKINRTIAELQHEYLQNLIQIGDVNVGRAIYRLSILNEAIAIMRISLKD